MTRDAAQREENERGDIFQPKDVANAPDDSTTEISSTLQDINIESSSNSTSRSESPNMEDHGPISQGPSTLTETDSTPALAPDQPSTSAGSSSASGVIRKIRARYSRTVFSRQVWRRGVVARSVLQTGTLVSL